MTSEKNVRGAPEAPAPRCPQCIYRRTDGMLMARCETCAALVAAEAPSGKDCPHCGGGLNQWGHTANCPMQRRASASAPKWCQHEWPRWGCGLCGAALTAEGWLISASAPVDSASASETGATYDFRDLAAEAYQAWLDGANVDDMLRVMQKIAPALLHAAPRTSNAQPEAPEGSPYWMLLQQTNALRVENDRLNRELVSARQTNDMHCTERDAARAEVARLITGSAQPGELDALAQRIAKGRAKYPTGCTVLSLLDEAGEVAHAVNKREPAERVRDELLDVAAVAMRLYAGEIDTAWRSTFEMTPCAGPSDAPFKVGDRARCIAECPLGPVGEGVVEEVWRSDGSGRWMVSLRRKTGPQDRWFKHASLAEDFELVLVSSEAPDGGPGEAGPILQPGEWTEAEKVLRGILYYAEQWEDGDDASPFHALGHVRKLLSDHDAALAPRPSDAFPPVLVSNITGTVLGATRSGEDPAAAHLQQVADLANAAHAQRRRGEVDIAEDALAREARRESPSNRGDK